ncbi:MAG: hypothetical protein AAGC88_02255 [Bacteroidota bacterium]
MHIFDLNLVNMHKSLTTIVLMSCIHLCIATSKDTVNLSGEDLLMSKLNNGTSKYLVYIEKADESLIDMSIWTRTVSDALIDGTRFMKIEQTWRNVNSDKERSLVSYCEWSDFEPLYHYVERTEEGKELIEAFTFREKLIVGTDSVDNNSKLDFSLKLDNPTLNWELDMEVFQTLPYEENMVFSINFYHPGSRKGPQDYHYTVGELVSLPQHNGTSIMSWPLSIDYGNGNQATFWIADESREVLRMEEKFGGIRRYKIKLP